MVKKFGGSAFEMENGKQRSTCHNYYMDCLHIFLRYLKKIGKADFAEVEAIEDRKILGDLACAISYHFAILAR